MCVQITVFRMGSEGQKDIEMAILTALLKGNNTTHTHTHLQFQVVGVAWLLLLLRFRSLLCDVSPPRRAICLQVPMHQRLIS